MAFQEANEVLASVFSSWFGLSPDSIFLANAFVLSTIVAALLIILALLIALFLDFITDVWKIPFASAVDVAKYVALSIWWFSPLAAAAGFIIFLWLSDTPWLSWPFALISATIGLLPWLLGSGPFAVLLAIFPVNTAMMFVATILD